MKALKCFLFLFLFAFTLSHAEKIQLWTPNEGLSNSHISQIYQDSRGYIWIATENGLNKFNGYHFTVYTQQPGDSTSLQGNFVYAVLEDSRGRFWVGTMNGLLQYNREKDHFQSIRIQADGRKLPLIDPGEDFCNLSKTKVHYLFEDKQGNISSFFPYLRLQVSAAM